jgi:glutaminyl-peptide cyclotransferase
MIQYKGLWAGLMCCLLIAGCQPPETATLSSAQTANVALAAVDGERALALVRELVAITPRNSGTPGAEKAAQWISDQISPFVDTCEIDTFVDDTITGPMSFHNVLATLKGTGEKTVILGSHFDTKSGISDTFQGANDSGSSTGLLIELARVLHGQPRLPFTIVFAFFDGEECQREYGPLDGLHGSRHYAGKLAGEKRLDSIRAMIVLDMIGDKDLTVTIPRNTTKALTVLAFKAAAAEGIRDRFRLARGDVLDDHVPFLERGVPTLNLIDFEHGSAPGLNDYWHTEQDSLENISAESLQHIGRITVRILAALAAQ